MNKKITGYWIKRSFAFLFDWYVCFLLSNGMSYVLNGILSPLEFQSEKFLKMILIASVLISSVICYILIPTFLWVGQTIMQRAMQIKVVRDDNKEITIQLWCLRFFVGCLLFEGAFYSMSTLIYSEFSFWASGIGISSIDQVIGKVVLIISVVSCGIGIADRNNKKLVHDYLSKTRVIDISRAS